MIRQWEYGRKMDLLPIGFGNYVVKDKILMITSPDSAPIKRMIGDARERGMLVDASFGRSSKSLVLLSSGHLVLSSCSTEELTKELRLGS